MSSRPGCGVTPIMVPGGQDRLSVSVGQHSNYLGSFQVVQRQEPGTPLSASGNTSASDRAVNSSIPPSAISAISNSPFDSREATSGNLL